MQELNLSKLNYHHLEVRVDVDLCKCRIVSDTRKRCRTVRFKLGEDSLYR